MRYVVFILVLFLLIGCGGGSSTPVDPGQNIPPSNDEPVTPITPEAGLNVWSSPGRDNSRSYNSPYVGPSNPELLWSVKFNLDEKSIRNDPVIGPLGDIYIIDYTDIASVSPYGEVNWQYSTTRGIEGDPQISSDGNINIITEEKLISLNYDGNVVSEYDNVFFLNYYFPTGAGFNQFSHDPAYGEPGLDSYDSHPAIYPILGDDDCYYGCNPGNVAIKTDITGTIQWSYETPDGNHFRQTIVAKDIVYYITNYELYALSRETGELQWTKSVHARGVSFNGNNMLIGLSDDTLYMTCTDESSNNSASHVVSARKSFWEGLRAYSPTGELKWEIGEYGNYSNHYELGSVITMNGDGQIIWLHSKEYPVHVLNSDGSHSHSFAYSYVDSPSWFTSLITTDGDGNTYRFHKCRYPEDDEPQLTQIVSHDRYGNQRWAFTIAIDITPSSNIVIDALGVIYVVTTDGYLHAIGEGSTPILLPPANVSASNGTYGDHVRIDWDASEDADGYIVYRADLGQELGFTRETSWLDYTVDGIDDYDYSVISTNKAGSSAVSETVTGKLKPPTGSTVPGNTFDWSHPGHDCGKTHRAAATGPTSANLLSKIELGALETNSFENQCINEVVFGADGTAYLTAPTLLCAIDDDGQMSWKYQLPFTHVSAPFIDKNGNIHLINGRFPAQWYCVSPDRSLVRKQRVHDQCEIEAITPDRKALLLEDGVLNAYNLAGDLIWSDTELQFPMVDQYGNMLGMNCMVGGLKVLDTNGNETLTVESERFWAFMDLYLGIDDTFIENWRYDPLSSYVFQYNSVGETIASVEIEDVLSDLAIGANGMVFAQSWYHQVGYRPTMQLVAIDLESQEYVWKAKFDDFADSKSHFVAPLIDGAGNIYTVDPDNQIVYAFNPDGDRLWKYQLDFAEGSDSTSISMSPSGKLFVANDANQLFILN